MFETVLQVLVGKIIGAYFYKKRRPGIQVAFVVSEFNLNICGGCLKIHSRIVSIT